MSQNNNGKVKPMDSLPGAPERVEPKGEPTRKRPVYVLDIKGESELIYR
jgi:hypothetical protein